MPRPLQLNQVQVGQLRTWLQARPYKDARAGLDPDGLTALRQAVGIGRRQKPKSAQLDARVAGTARAFLEQVLQGPDSRDSTNMQRLLGRLQSAGIQALYAVRLHAGGESADLSWEGSMAFPLYRPDIRACLAGLSEKDLVHPIGFKGPSIIWLNHLYNGLMRHSNSNFQDSEMTVACVLSELANSQIATLNTVYDRWLACTETDQQRCIARKIDELIPQKLKEDLDMDQSGFDYERCLVLSVFLLAREDVQRQADLDGLDARTDARRLLARVDELRVCDRLMTGLGRLMCDAILMADPPAGVTHVTAADIGSYASQVFIGMGPNKWRGWGPRVAAIREALKAYPGVRVQVAVVGDLLPQLHRVVDSILTPEQAARVDYSVQAWTGDYGAEGATWFRDRLTVGFNSETGEYVMNVSASVLREIPNAVFVMKRLQGAGMRVSDFDSLERGQYVSGADHTGRPLCLIGITELQRLQDILLQYVPHFSFFDQGSHADAIQILAFLEGKRVVIVGDPATGQAFEHIDLYVTLRSDGTVMMADLEAGWQLLEGLDDDGLRAWADQHEEKIHAQQAAMGFDPEDDLLLSFLRKLQEPNNPFRELTRLYAASMQKQIRREAVRLRKAGLCVQFVPVIPFPGSGVGLSSLNSIAHKRVDDGQTVRPIPSFGAAIDEAVLAAFAVGEDPRQQETRVLVDGFESVGIDVSGSLRCLTFVFGRREPHVIEPAFLGSLWTHRLIGDFIEASRRATHFNWVSPEKKWGNEAQLVAHYAKALPPNAADLLGNAYAEIFDMANTAQIKNRLRREKTRLWATMIETHQVIAKSWPLRADEACLQNPFYWMMLMDHSAHVVLHQPHAPSDNASVLFGVLAFIRRFNSMNQDHRIDLPPRTMAT